MGSYYSGRLCKERADKKKNKTCVAVGYMGGIRFFSLRARGSGLKPFILLARF